MQVHRIIAKLAALVGVTLALTLASATGAGAQAPGYDGYEGYEAGDDCPPGYEGYAGYEGCGEDTDPGTGGETAAPPAGGTGGTGGLTSLPDTGGVAMVGFAGAAAAAGLALRRLSRS